MPKLALFVVAAALTGGVAVVGVVSIPRAMRAHQSAHPAPLAAQLSTLPAPQPALHRGVVTIDPVTVVGDPRSSFRAQLQAPAALEARSPAAAAPCEPTWQTLRAGPTERRYRELCASELARGTVDTPDRPKAAGPQQERLAVPTHQAIDDHVVDPRAHAASRPPLQIGEPESP